MEYILFIHNNVDQPTTEDQWKSFFEVANKSGIFNGGSEINNSIQIGTKRIIPTTESVAGFMRFETDDINSLYQLLELHPVCIQGGTIELCEMPKT